MDEEGLEPLVEGQVVAGKYELVRPLAKGGMGSVWLARHASLETELAIKFMAPELVASSHLRARFKREAKAAAQLKSRHVVRVLDHGVDDEVPYIAMELLEGEDLKTRLRRERRLSLADTLELLRQIEKALSQAHAAGIVHRDLKPANIFIARVDGDEVVKVLDFGVAKLTAGADDGESTRTGVVVGSPNYMSPEQARTVGDVDHRSDLWSLGVILFRCIAGKPPFRGATMADVMVRICAEPIPKPSDYADDLSPDVDAFFARALERDRDRRFQSLDELTAAFAALVEAEDAGPTLVETPAARAAQVSVSGPSSFGSAPVFDEEATTVARDVGTLTGQSAVTSPSASTTPPARTSWLALGVGAAMAVFGAVAFALSRSEPPVQVSGSGAEQVAPTAVSRPRSTATAVAAPPPSPAPPPTTTSTPMHVPTASPPAAKEATPTPRPPAAPQPAGPPPAVSPSEKPSWGF